MSGKIVGSVRGQVLHLIYPPLVEGTVDYLTAEFSFSGDWDGLSKWAHFKQGSTIYDVPLTNDTITEDQHLNLSAGTWDVYLHGSGDNRRITTTTVRMKVLPYLDEDGEPLPEVPLTFAEVLDQRAQRIQAVAYAVEAGESARKEAERSRELSEFARVQAEAERTGAEADRASAETERSSAEAARKNAEQDRVSSENARSSAEDTRRQNEEARQAAEVIREQNEEARVEAEKNRKDGITPHIGDNGNWYLGDADTGRPSRGETGAGMDIAGATVGQIAKITAVDDTGKPTAWEAVDMPISFKPAGKSYLTFSSPNIFTLAVNDATKHWDGTLEYFASDKTWTVWDGTTTLSAIADDGEYVLYLRGTGNTVITGNSENYRWVLTGTDIKCIGNIENLLDYATVASGAHPTMATYCYRYMFYGCTSLTNAPDLPATKLANYCYSSMFQGCTALAQAPALPVTTLVDFCYSSMFQGCTALAQAPALPATALARNCYQFMFYGCTALAQAPALPATALAIYCYSGMFQGCTSLTNAPSLPATTLADSCYRSMFQGCTSLTQAPALPATTLANTCYQRMFYGCTGLTQVPALPATTLAIYCYRGMFQGCTSLKLSSTKTGEYTQEYRIPSSGAGTTATDALTDMFISTGGTFTGTPAINTTYYLSSDNMIVRETEIDTLNGYVDSMIDVAIAEHTSNPLNITGATVGQIAKITAVDDTGKPTAWEAVDMPISFKPAGKSYLTFSSPSSFTLKVNDATKHWDGTLEYFASDKTWTVWDETTTLSAVDNDGEYVLYLRGTGNTVITGSSANHRWVLTGTDIKCIGNIENLLDYTTVASGEHPTMVSSCYSFMFRGCTGLTQAPELPATTLADNCYQGMFQGCTSITQAPALPAITLASYCYNSMFYGCKGLTQAPALPATTLENSCYSYIFSGCTSLTQAPALPATTLVNQCYYYMFYGCTGLIQAPALPATTLADSCYYYMFQGCTGLTQVPALPATTLAIYCYRGMFYGCTSLKLSSTKTGEYTQEYRIPSSGDGVAATDALADMFTSTGGTFTGTPAINTTYYLSSDNMIVRETEIDTLNGYVGSMIDAIRIPEKLPNPHALTFTGAVEGSYDGSAEKTINIPGGGGGDIALGITGATVGQIAKITAVDESGKPTEWEAADMPSGGGEKPWRYDKLIEFSEDTAGFTLDTFDDGSPFDFTEIEVRLALKNASGNNVRGDVKVYLDGKNGSNNQVFIGGTDASVSPMVSNGKYYMCVMQCYIDLSAKTALGIITSKEVTAYLNTPLPLNASATRQYVNFTYSNQGELNVWNVAPTKFTSVTSSMTIGAGSSVWIRGR